MKFIKALGLGMGLFLGAYSSEAQVIRILPLGDSVTSSFEPYNSYRRPLYHMLVNAGYTVDFVGSQSGVGGNPATNPDFDQNHEGHAGWHASDGDSEIENISRASRPDIILLDLGANDAEQGEDNLGTIEELRSLITKARSINPNVMIIMAQPTPVPVNNARLAKLSQLIARLARAENTVQSPVYVANLRSGFNRRRDTFDGEHPNDVGDAKIAKRFFDKIVYVLSVR